MTESTPGPHRPVEQGALPEDLDQLVRGTRSAEELAASLTGRWPRTRLLHQYDLPRVDDPGLTLLQTTGPALGRDIELVDAGTGTGASAVVATSTELVVLERLPQAVTVELREYGDPLDRLLDRHGVDWDSQLIRAVAIRAPSPAVQLLRRIWLDCLVGALVSEEHLLASGEPAAPGPPEPVT